MRNSRSVTSTGARILRRVVAVLVAAAPLAVVAYAPSSSAAVVGPGGLSGAKVWLKAGSLTGAEGSAVTTWNDSSSSGYNVTQAAPAQQPTLYATTSSNLVNFNPTVVFDGADDRLHNATPIMASSSPYTFITTGVNDATDTSFRSVLSSQASFDQLSMYSVNGAPYTGSVVWGGGFAGDYTNDTSVTSYAAPGGPSGYWNGSTYVSDTRTKHAQPQIRAINTANGATTDPFNNWVDGFMNTAKWFAANNSPIFDGMGWQANLHKSITIGADGTTDGGGAEFWKGRIPEVISFGSNLTPAEMARVNTYLAIKYGVTLGQGNGAVGANGLNTNYVATDGSTVIWNALGNQIYKYNIAGLGRDDAEGLSQKQSQSVNAGLQVTIGNGNQIGATNAANASTFAADKSYLVWGDDGASTCSPPRSSESPAPTSASVASGECRRPAPSDPFESRSPARTPQPSSSSRPTPPLVPATPRMPSPMMASPTSTPTST